MADDADVEHDERPDGVENEAAESESGADTEAGDEGDETGADTGDALSDGDFVRIDYTVRTAEDDTVVDTTVETVAEEADLDTEDHEFSPRTIIVGAGHVFAAVDEALVGAAVGDEGTVSIPAPDAFGEFDPDDVRTISAEKIDEDDRYPGARVRVDGEQGHVETVIGGRARVDFNHPLAGEDLEYEYEVVERVEDRVEQARGLLGIHLQEAPEVRIEVDEVEEEVQVEVDADDADSGDEEDEDDTPEYRTETRTVEKETLYIEATPQMAMNQQWLFQKQQIAGDLIDRLGVDRVIVEEVLTGGGMGMGMGGMMGGTMGEGDVEEALADEDIDAEEIVEEIEAADE